MTPDLPGPPGGDERDLADALDAALDAGAAGASGPRTPSEGEVGRLSDLAGALRQALPLPALPSGGRSDIRAAASAARAVRRPSRYRLAGAAVITLMVGAVAGGTIGSALGGSSRSPTPPRPAIPTSSSPPTRRR